MPIYEYKCEDGHLVTALVKIANRKNPQKCSCGKQAEFIVSCPTIALDGTDPGFPDAYDKFATRHEKASNETPSGNITHW